MKKLTKKLVLSILTVALTFIALGTSTFAWFSMNDTVSVTGMTVTTRTSDTLFVASDTLTSTAVKSDAEFKTSMVENALSALLEPVSTTNGTSFFYTATNNVESSGAAKANTYTAYAEGDTFDTNYGVNDTTSTPDAKGYLDYVFQLKAVNASDAARYVNVTSLKLTYGNTTDTSKAFRVAIFVEDLGYIDTADHTSASAGAEGTLLTILRNSSAQYFGILNAGTYGHEDKAVASTTTLGDVDTKLDDAAVIGTVARKTTHFYKVVVRLWLEGEDTTCNNNTFASLTSAWNLDLTIKLEDANTNAITSMTQATTTAIVDLSSGPAVTSNTIVIDGTTYYEISGKTLNNDGTTKLYKAANSAVAIGDKIYVIDATNHPYDVTNQCTLPTA